MTTGTSVSGGLSSGRMSATLTPTVDPKQQALDEVLKKMMGRGDPTHGGGILPRGSHSTSSVGDIGR
jgi:hypothetical protein